MEEYLKFAINISKYAGDLILKYFDIDNKEVEYKSDKTPVTIVDKQINKYLIDQVKVKYPNHGVCGEEEKYNESAKYLWVCDPLDGTSMFTRHIPVSVFSLALVIDGKPVVGVVYDPFLNELYTAIKGKGAYCNNKEIHVNNLDYGDLGCSIDYCMWNNSKYDTLEIIKELREYAKICQIGSVARASMAIASGKICAEIFPGTEHGNCDIAASKLIVEEAGGKVTNFFGEDQRYDEDIDGSLLTNGKLHEVILKKINNIYGG